MNNNFDNEESKKTIMYSNYNITPEYMNNTLNTGALYGVMLLAERYKTDPKTNCGIPSDSAVEDVRDWSIEKKV